MTFRTTDKKFDVPARCRSSFGDERMNNMLCVKDEEIIPGIVFIKNEYYSFIVLKI